MRNQQIRRLVIVKIQISLIVWIFQKILKCKEIFWDFKAFEFFLVDKYLWKVRKESSGQSFWEAWEVHFTISKERSPYQSLIKFLRHAVFYLLKVVVDLNFFNSGSPNRERHHSAGSQSLTKINQINMEPEFTQTTKKIKHQKSSSFSTLKRAKKEWKKLFK